VAIPKTISVVRNFKDNISIEKPVIFISVLPLGFEYPKIFPGT